MSLKVNTKGIVAFGNSDSFLDKQGALKKGADKRTQTRWFVLKANLFFYYKSENDFRAQKDPIGVICLEDYAVESDGTKGFKLASLHGGESGQKEFLLEAPSAEEAEGWVTTLQKASFEYLRGYTEHLCRVLRNAELELPAFTYHDFVEQRARARVMPGHAMTELPASSAAATASANGAHRDRSNTDTARAASAKILAEIEAEKAAERESASEKAVDETSTPSIKHLSKMFDQEEGASKPNFQKAPPTMQKSVEPSASAPPPAPVDPEPESVAPKPQAEKSLPEDPPTEDVPPNDSQEEMNGTPAVEEAGAENDGADPDDAALAHLLGESDETAETAETAEEGDVLGEGMPTMRNKAAEAGDQRRPSMGSAELRKARMRNSALIFSAGDTERNSGSFSMASNANEDAKCTVCNKTAYAMEKIVADGLSFHKTCFRCAVPECNKVISLGNYAALEGKNYCKPCFKKLFKLKGNYSEGFGKEQHKMKWVNPETGSEATTDDPDSQA